MENNIATTHDFFSRSAASLRIAVVGVGALGSAVCGLLLLGGWPHVLLVDPDTIAPRNLPLSRLFQEAGPGCHGRPKVAVLQELARRQGLDWHAVQAEIADVGLARLASCEVLVSCTDSALARVETAFAARSLRLPMLDGGVQSGQIPEGRAGWFASSPQAACYLCGLSENRRGELLAYALAPSLGCLAPAETEAMTGAFRTVQTVAEALVALLGETSDESFALRLRDDAGPERILLARSQGCPWHALPLPGRLLCLPGDEPMRAAIPDGSVLELPWPVCLRARCLRCGVVCAPRLRTARVRRTLACPACGEAGCLQPLETVERLAAGHPLARQTPRQLGLPDQHLYHRRRAMFAEQEREPDLS